MPDSKIIPGFYVERWRFAAGQRVLIAYQVGAIVVDRSPALESEQSVENNPTILYKPAREGRDGQPNLDAHAVRDAHTVVMLTRAGDVETLKDRDFETPCSGHPAVDVISNTLWAHYQAGKITSIDMRYHMEYIHMRAIARAILQAGAVMAPACELLGITRHCLRRRLQKFGMPQLVYWREKSSEWREELAEFARGGDRDTVEERSGDLGEQLIDQDPSFGAPPISGPASTRENLGEQLVAADTSEPGPTTPIESSGPSTLAVVPGPRLGESADCNVLPFHRGGPF